MQGVSDGGDGDGGDSDGDDGNDAGDNGNDNDDDDKKSVSRDGCWFHVYPYLYRCLCRCSAKFDVNERRVCDDPSSLLSVTMRVLHEKKREY